MGAAKQWRERLKRPNIGWRKRLEKIASELRQTICLLPDNSFSRLARRIARAKRIFVAGAGRTGLVMRMFAMRLVQCGLFVHAAGDATTPAIRKGDLLIIASGSGVTATMVVIARAARAAGANMILLTAQPRSTLARIAPEVVRLPVPLDARRPGGLASAQLLGTCFEQCLLIFCDLLIEEVAAARRQRESDLARRHANLE